MLRLSPTQILVIEESFNWRNCKQTWLVLCFKRKVDIAVVVADGDIDSTLRNPASKAPFPAPLLKSDWTDPVDFVSLATVRSEAAASLTVTARPAASGNVFNRLFLNRLRYQHQFCVQYLQTRRVFCSSFAHAGLLPVRDHPQDQNYLEGLHVVTLLALTTATGPQRHKVGAAVKVVNNSNVFFAQP